jgi:hypothetical protein
MYINKGTGKVVLVHAIKSYRGMEAQLHPFLTLALDWGEWSV